MNTIEQDSPFEVYVRGIQHCLDHVTDNDGGAEFWWSRMGSMLRIKRIFDMQNGCCAYCNQLITYKELVEPQVIQGHHLKPKTLGGSNRIENIKLLHGHCHSMVHKDYTREEMSKLVDKGVDYLGQEAT